MELEALLPSAGDGEVAFYGGTFSLLPSQVQQAYLDAVQPHIAAGRVAGVRVSTRPDALDESRVKFLAARGVTTVEIGCQSFDGEVLRRSRRGHFADDIAPSVHRLRDKGLKVGLQLMPGLPGGDREEALFSLDKALELQPDFLRIYPTVVFSGTELYRLWSQGGYLPMSLDEAVEVCAEMLKRCRAREIPVIRVGLQGGSEFDSGDVVVAGPYHPAFGQLVKSRLWLSALESLPVDGRSLAVRVNPSDFSDAVGHRRQNKELLTQRFDTFEISGDREVPRGMIASGKDTFFV